MTIRPFDFFDRGGSGVATLRPGAEARAAGGGPRRLGWATSNERFSREHRVSWYLAVAAPTWLRAIEQGTLRKHAILLGPAVKAVPQTLGRAVTPRPARIPGFLGSTESPTRPGGDG